MNQTKLPCDVIKDLLPLYHDGVCSKDSRALVEEHLSRCAECNAEYQKLNRESPMTAISEPASGTGELSAASLKQVRRLILWKRITASLLAAFILLAAIFGGIYWMNRQVHPVVYNSESPNIVVSYNEYGDIGLKLYGSDWDIVHSRLIELEGQQILIFSMTASIWDEIARGKNSYSSYPLVSGDSEQIPDAIYYMYGNISDYSYDELTELFAKGDGPFTKLWESK